MRVKIYITKGIECQGPKHSCDLGAGAQSPSHFFVGNLRDINLWNKQTKKSYIVIDIENVFVLKKMVCR